MQKTRQNSNEILWKSDFIRNQFMAKGVRVLDDFFNIEGRDVFKELLLKKHLRSGFGKRNNYRIWFIRIKNTRFLLKTASGKYYNKLLDEFLVLKYLPALYITPPEVGAYYVHDSDRVCFILFKYPPGFHVLRDLIELKLPPHVLADFEVRKRKVMKKISKALHKMHYSEFYYPYLFSENILVKHKSDEICIIDLEDFKPLKKCPWYYRLEIVSWFIKREEWNTLRTSLASNMYTKKYMKSLLN